jgi:hypothetical protein
MRALLLAAALVGSYGATPTGEVKSSSRPFAEEPAVRGAVWGMTLDEVRKLHPGGVQGAVEHGTEYRLVAPALGLPRVLVTFSFESSGLWAMTFSCPGKDGKINPTTGEVSWMKKAEASAMRRTLRDRLAAKLGEPTLEVENTDMAIQWELPGEMVLLGLPRTPRVPDEGGVSITYLKPSTEAPTLVRTPR